MTKHGYQPSGLHFGTGILVLVRSIREGDVVGVGSCVKLTDNHHHSNYDGM